MKKTIIFFTIIALSGLSLIAQSPNTKKADKHFSRFEFVEAAQAYTKLVENDKADAYVYGQLAESYYNVFNTAEAERWYAKALETSENPEMMYKYAEMLRSNGKYDASNEWMTTFSKSSPEDIRAIAFNANPNYLSELLAKDEKFDISTIEGLNSPQSDFGGTLEGGDLYFSSSRNNKRRTYGWNEQPFLDIYQATKGGDGAYQEPVLINKKINTRYHEGLVSFSPDGKTMYFSRESHSEKVFKKDTLTRNRYDVLHLFKATKLGDDWDTVEGFSMNSENYSVKNPSVSSDGKTLYFASDMPGGLGKFDIYKAAINEDGSLGAPENLGKSVNTEGQEMFPYSSSNGTLYFSSNGRLGLGGLDVFYINQTDGMPSVALNLGAPVNSNADDFAFTINEQTKEGFVSSNRVGGQGSDDVYAINRIEPLCDVDLIAVVTDSKTGNPIGSATVLQYDDQGNDIDSKIANNEGEVEFTTTCDTRHDLEASHPGYYSKRVTVAGTQDDLVRVPMALDPIEKAVIVEDRVILNPLYFDYDKSNIKPQAAFELDKLVAIMQKYEDIVINVESHTDSRGRASYNKNLSDRRAKSTVAYVISKGIDQSRISGVGKGESEPKEDCGSNCSEAQHQTNRRSDFIIVSGGPGQD